MRRRVLLPRPGSDGARHPRSSPTSRWVSGARRSATLGHRTCAVALALVVVLVATGSAGCSSKVPDPASAAGSSGAKSAAASSSKTGPQPTPPEQPSKTLGTIQGIVRLAPDAQLPEYTPAEVGIKPGGAKPPEACGPAREETRRPVRLGAQRVLENVTVAATGDAKHFIEALGPERLEKRAPVQHTVTIRHCQLTPRTIVATAGDTLKIVNESDYPFMPDYGRPGFVQAVPRNEPLVVPLAKGGFLPLQCAFSASCGRADVLVLAHPVHGVTNAEGRFRITNVPAGKEVVLHAGHPLFEEATAKATVAAGQTATVEIVIKPRLDTAKPAP